MAGKTPRDPNYVQKGFGLKKQISGLLQNDYHSHLVDALRERGHRLVFGDVTIRLAKDFGFCYGVDRAVDLAYETREHFPDKTLYITNEIIHNPYVNRRLVELGVRFLGRGYTLDDVTADDVVILPAFGVTVAESAELEAKGCVRVDTTCGSVMNVWRRVRQYVKDGRTSVIHGKWAHEETRATSSRAVEGECHYIVVRDHDETNMLCDYIRGKESALSREAFQERFKDATSPGFDPDLHLERIGLANQTTMLSSESLEIAHMVGEAVRDRYGEEEHADRFRSFDTICSATQDLQDAALQLGHSGELDLLLVVGGYNSSNTSHLVEIGGEFCPSFHIDCASEITSAAQIRHQPLNHKTTSVTNDWLPDGPVCVGVTAGASTPNRIVGEVIERVLQVRGIDPHDHIEDLPRRTVPLPVAN
ncbi:MAG TPA: 4-hydroxy-3-methylbut-2-enyl diphosphate reductase [Planctomycetes bacterium]|nr:4-hydroxy-3-methylbut-2-enyl diphosphate reductase [Planctomycetota bacterium]